MVNSVYPWSGTLVVWVTFELHGFAGSPHAISDALGIAATETIYSSESSSWSIHCDLFSDDVNVHLRDLLELLKGKEDRIRPEWNPQFCVEWQKEGCRPAGDDIYAADVVAGIARCGAVLREDVRKD